MTAGVFFLPIETRPKDFPPIPQMRGIFWHTGLIWKGRVYECFNQGRHSISNFDEDKQDSLKNQRAVILKTKIDERRLETEILSGTDCAEYVARVIGMSNNKGAIKQYWPQEVHDFIKSAGVNPAIIT